MYNNYCSSAVTIVTRTRLNGTLYVSYLFCCRDTILDKEVSVRNMGINLEKESLSLGVRCFFKKFSGSLPSFQPILS